MQTPLPYAQPLPWYRTNHAQRIAVALTIVAAVVCGSAWTFRFMQQLEFLREQSRWMKYSIPADQPVFVVNTSDASTLAQSAGYQPLFWGGNPGGPAGAVANRDPHVFNDLIWTGREALVFLHRLRAPGRKERLIEVTVEPAGGDLGDSSANLQAQTIVPAGPSIGDRPYNAGECLGLSGHYCFDRFASLRVFGGQLDPANESHFTIPYEINGKSNVIDGWLLSDDSVKLEPRG